jgi:hypothetical protein
MPGKGVMTVLRYRIALLGAAAALVAGCEATPQAQLPQDNGRQLKVLDQGWTADQRAQFYHASQGSVLMPYRWLLALEQPEVKFIGTVGLFLDNDYIGRFGFLPGRPMPGHEELPKDCVPSDDPADVNYTCGLPVGFSRTLLAPDALSINGVVERDVVGLTCSACHTGELHYKGTALRIDGASAQMDPTTFQSALGGALLLTARLPFRFNRFADRVLARPEPPADRSNAKYREQFEMYKAQLDAYELTRDVQRAALRKKLDTFLSASSSETLTAIRKGLYAKYPGGFGRTDALARITNMVFGTEMGNDDNLVVGSAPVMFPMIWDSPYFSWAQYNNSIEQAMTRNVGESLGVRAKIDYVATDTQWDGEGVSRLATTVDVAGLMGLETLLRGRPGDYFSGLKSPVWPEAYFGPIEWQNAREGKVIYEQRCAGCHHPPLADLVERDANGMLRPRADTLPPLKNGTHANNGGKGYWISNNAQEMLTNLAPGPWPEDEKQWFLSLESIDVGTIGTDPGQATNFARNIISTKQTLLPSFPVYTADSTRAVPVEDTQYPVRTMPAGVGLQKVTLAIVNSYFDRADALLKSQGLAAFAATLPPNLRQADGSPAPGLVKDGKVNRDFWNGYRTPGAVAYAAYHAPPLNGIWASPPYLHNGSVPTIDALLSPLNERPSLFFVGSRQYDVEHIGYRTDRFPGAFKFDTSVPGNANTGHRFENGPRGNGVIGSALEPAQRRNVIEFLKTLCPPGRWTDYAAGKLCAPTPPTNSARAAAGE